METRTIGSLEVSAARPEVASVISGAMTAEQVVANVAAAEWRLDGAEWAEVADLTRR